MDSAATMPPAPRFALWGERVFEPRKRRGSKGTRFAADETGLQRTMCLRPGGVTDGEPVTSAEPDLPPYPPQRILSAPFSERIELACRTWAAQVTPNQPIVLAMYWAKYFFVFIGVWALFNMLNEDYAGFLSVQEWAFSATAFKKAIVWAIFYELCGLGCSWGPMNARFKPMTLGFRYYLRPGTTKLPLFPGVPVIGNHTRSWLDVGVYTLNQLCLLRVLVAPEVTPDLLLPSLLLIPAMGVLDKTLFLAARAEHYWVALVCLVVASTNELWIPACMVLWVCVWFWAATSKLNQHFPSVIMVMMNNGPFFPKILKKRLFKSYPDNLRPSRFAELMAHFGTTTEYLIAILLITSTDPTLTWVMLCVASGFHGFIALNNPSGMPIEWNILMVYGGFFLFGFHPDATLAPLLARPELVAFLFFCLVAVPAYGNFVPYRVSFLLAMRYYAGNWSYNVWLFKRGAAEKMKQNVQMPAPLMREQLEQVIPDPEIVEVSLATMSSNRFMHEEGRPILEALPHAVDDIEDYEWMEGELVGGSAIGWNFGDGHLNGRYLLQAIQEQCQFEEGELRMITVESQPLFGPAMAWEVFDAAAGKIAEGRTVMKPFLGLPPWPHGRYADALVGDGSATETGD